MCLQTYDRELTAAAIALVLYSAQYFHLRIDQHLFKSDTEGWRAEFRACFLLSVFKQLNGKKK